jgi:ATP-dependent Clp protease ATP-binding subunit ClpA
MLKQIVAFQARNVIPLYPQFEAEATQAGARFIEAEHMLLALAAAAETEAGRLLIESGLDHDRLAAVLRDELRQSLAFAGIQAPAVRRGEATDPNRQVSMGTSAKAALMRAVHTSHRERSRSRRRLDGIDLLIGILKAELGTVPRALAIAGVDRAGLLARARTAGRVTGSRC